jgi:surface antigen Omp85-like protein
MIALALDSVSRRSYRQRVVRPLVFALLLGCVSTVACTSSVPRKYLPYPLTNDTFDDPVKVVNIPLPVIKTDPNEGVSLGVLSALLLHNKNDEIGTMIVPQANYNQNFGLTLRLFGAFYPEPGRRWEFTLSKSTHVNEDYTLKFRDSTWLDHKLELTGEATVFTDGAARFFGFQSESSSRDETNYADEEKGFNVSVAYRILPHVQLMIGERFRRVDVGRGAVTSLPGIQDVFSAAEVPGINGFTAHAQRVGATFSTLDDPNLPTGGFYGTGVFEITTKALGSTADYRHYMVELKGFLPLKDARYVTAVRTAYNQTLNRDVPFLEQSILGGKNTLRGHGENRFVDSSYLLLNVEERIRLFRYRLFNVNTDWEIAPFIDIGEVAKNLLDVTAKNFVVNPGIGFRAVVRPNFVGRVDIGFGKEGPAVFATLGYPF